MAAKVNVILGMDARGFSQGIDKATKQINDFSKTTIGELKSSFIKLAGGATIGAMVANMADFSKEVRVSAAALGLSIKQVQQLRTIARHANKDLSDFSAVFRFMNTFASNALGKEGGLSKTSKEGQIAAKYGITAEDLTGPKSLSNFNLMKKFATAAMKIDPAQARQDLKSVFGPKNILWMSSQMKDLAKPDLFPTAEQGDIDVIADLKDAFMDLTDIVRTYLITGFVNLIEWIANLTSSYAKGTKTMSDLDKEAQSVYMSKHGGKLPGTAGYVAKHASYQIGLAAINANPFQSRESKDVMIANMQKNFIKDIYGEGIWEEVIKNVKVTESPKGTVANWMENLAKTRAERQAKRAAEDKARGEGHPERAAALHTKGKEGGAISALTGEFPLVKIGGLLGMDLAYRMFRVSEQANVWLEKIYNAVSTTAKDIEETKEDPDTENN